MQILTIIGIFAAMGAMAFALQNNIPVTVIFLVWRFDGSLAMVLVIALALGAIAVTLVSIPGMVRRNLTIAQLRKEIASPHHAKAGEGGIVLPTGSAKKQE